MLKLRYGKNLETGNIGVYFGQDFNPFAEIMGMPQAHKLMEFLPNEDQFDAFRVEEEDFVELSADSEEVKELQEDFKEAYILKSWWAEDDESYDEIPEKVECVIIESPLKNNTDQTDEEVIERIAEMSEEMDRKAPETLADLSMVVFPYADEENEFQHITIHNEYLEVVE